jgi:HEAT repeat protein
VTSARVLGILACAIVGAAPARSIVVAQAPAQVHQRAPGLSFAGRSVAEWARLAVDDTSLYHRDRAIAALRRAPPAVRAEAVRQFVAALADSAVGRRTRALEAMGLLAVETQGHIGRFDGPDDLAPALPAVARVAADRRDALRTRALWLLAEAGRGARTHSLAPARAAVQDADPAVREAAVAVIGAAGDSTDTQRVIAALSDREADVRVAAMRALGLLGRREAVTPLLLHLRDTSRVMRAAAIQALARLGPTARAALPMLAALVTDTTNWRAGGSYAETIGAEAAWAVSRIIPRRGVSMIPARVDVDDRDAALRSDGLGTYVAGADSVKAYVSAALNLDLSGPRGDGRATGIPYVRKLPRSLTFDLRRPIAGSGARPLGIVKDNEAIIHLFWRHEHDQRMISITTLDPTDVPVDCERAEFEFRIDGRPYLLQMGEWTAAEFNPRAPRFSGAGTDVPHIWHLNADEWTVVAGPGSRARLWDMSNPARPVDKGLYVFPFAITWAQMLPR